MARGLNLGRIAVAVTLVTFGVSSGFPGEAIGQRFVAPRVAPVVPRVTPMPNLRGPTLPNLGKGPTLVLPPTPRVEAVPDVRACCLCAGESTCRSSCCTRR